MHVSVLYKMHILCVVLFSYHSITLYYSFCQLTQLEKLDIGWNTLKTVPEVVSSLTSLKRLDMWRCGISSLPERFVCHLFKLLLHNTFIISF